MGVLACERRPTTLFAPENVICCFEWRQRTERMVSSEGKCGLGNLFVSNPLTSGVCCCLRPSGTRGPSLPVEPQVPRHSSSSFGMRGPEIGNLEPSSDGIGRSSLMCSVQLEEGLPCVWEDGPRVARSRGRSAKTRPGAWSFAEHRRNGTRNRCC